MVPSISARDWNPVEPLPVTQSTPGRTNDRCPRRLAEAVPVPGANVCPVTPVANGPGFGWQRPVVIGGTTLDLGGAAYRLLQMGRLAQCGLERRLPANVIPSRCRCGPHVPAPPHRHRALPRGVPTPLLPQGFGRPARDAAPNADTMPCAAGQQLIGSVRSFQRNHLTARTPDPRPAVSPYPQRSTRRSAAFSTATLLALTALTIREPASGRA
jgi:hypothetical protein